MKAYGHVRGNRVEFLALLLKILFEFIRWVGSVFAQHCLVLWVGSREFHELFKCMTKWNKVCVCLIRQLCLTLCDPMGHSLPGSSVHGILQARILQWSAISPSRRFLQPRDRTCISSISCSAGRFFTTEPPGKPKWNKEELLTHKMWKLEKSSTVIWPQKGLYSKNYKKPWWKILKLIQADGRIYHILGLEESILLKWLYYSWQSIDSMPPSSNYQWHFSQNYNKKN